MPELTYLYAIVSQAGLPAALGPGLRGVDGAPVEELELGGLCAILSSVPASEWGPKVLNQHVQDLDWLAPRATGHQAVLAALHAAAPSLLPLPFATLYRRRAAVRDLLSARRDDLLAALARLAGADEWTLKVFQEHAVFEQQVEQLSSTFAEAAEQARTAPPGKAYLLRKRLDTLRRDEAARISTAQAHAIEEQLRAIASDVVREPIAGQAATNTRGAPQATRAVLKLALLMPRDEQSRHLARIEQVAEQYLPLGYRFEIAGPWPPYSFASVAKERQDG